MANSTGSWPDIEVVAADVGGTFTDVVLRSSDGAESVAKVPSTSSAYESAILDAVGDIVGTDGSGSPIRRLLHGSTVATNALLERKGARTALITTTGFRDVLELGRLRRPSLFDLHYVKPEPLVPRELRFEVRERIGADGEVIEGPSPDEVTRLVGQVLDEGVEAVALCLLNAYVNPLHERLIAGWLRDGFRAAGVEVPLSVSSELQRERREFERTSTTVINSYVAARVSTYLDRLSRGFAQTHGTETVQIMQSNGSLIPSGVAARFPCRLIESGPAAGVLAAARVVGDLNGGDAIAFDMGGTTAKAALIERGRPFEALQLEVGGGMNHDGASLTGSGYLIRMPSLDISEVGAGGGSIVWIDRSGTPRVGPESAGAEPGPACYDRGGRRPTVTDANLLIGLLDPAGIAGGRLPLRPELAEEVVEREIARPLGLDVAEAAWGIHRLANAAMAPALRSVTVEKGRSPEAYILVAYGGAGPMHAATLAEDFGVARVLIPPQPGLLCARGLLVAPVRQDIVVSCPPTATADAATCRSIVETVRTDIDGLLAELEAPAGAEPRITWQLSVRYTGQTSELLIGFEPEADLGGGDVRFREIVEARFTEAHTRTYGYGDAHAPIEIQSVRAAVEIEPTVTDPELIEQRQLVPLRVARREVTTRSTYFGRDVGWLDVPIVSDRAEIDRVDGPLIIQELDTTVVVPPGWTAERDASSLLLLEREDS